MIKFTLKDVFDEFNKNNIHVNLDDSLFYTTISKPKYIKNNFIGIISSLDNNIGETLESLREEGSSTVKYLFTSTAKPFSDYTIKLLLYSIFKKYNFEPYILRVNKTKKYEIELVITKYDLTDEYKNNISLDTDNDESQTESDISINEVLNSEQKNAIDIDDYDNILNENEKEISHDYSELEETDKDEESDDEKNNIKDDKLLNSTDEEDNQLLNNTDDEEEDNQLLNNTDDEEEDNQLLNNTDDENDLLNTTEEEDRIDAEEHIDTEKEEEDTDL